jgi:hypothetical protein
MTKPSPADLETLEMRRREADAAFDHAMKRVQEHAYALGRYRGLNADALVLEEALVKAYDMLNLAVETLATGQALGDRLVMGIRKILPPRYASSLSHKPVAGK